MKLSFFRRLADEQGLTFLLVFLAALLFVVYPFFSLGRMGAFLVDGFLSLVLLASALAVDRPRLRKVALSVALAAIASRLAFFLYPSAEMSQVELVLTIAYLWVVIVLLLARAFAKGRITVQRIQGAVAVYLLVGLVFGLMYALIELSSPGAIAFGVSSGDPMAGFVYYSFVTLTTLGYGDITPVTSAARQMAILEGLIGQLFPAILLARLVSLEIVHSSSENEDAGPD